MIKRFLKLKKEYDKSPTYIKSKGFFKVMKCLYACDDYANNKISKEKAESILNEIGLSLNEPKK